MSDQIKHPDTFCAAPFIAAEITIDGTLQPCCMYKVDEEMRRLPNEFPLHNFRNFKNWRENVLSPLKNELMGGIKHDRCNVCWERESVSKWHGSLRLEYNRQYKDYIAKEFDPNKLDDVRYLSVQFGNYCNLKCIQCNSMYSSSHETEEKQHKEKFAALELLTLRNSERKWYQTQEFEQLKPELISNLDRIQLYGGEPLITPQAIKFLNSIPDPSRVALNVITNASVIKDDVFELLSKFKSIQLNVSLDGTGEHAEYVRYGCSWSDVDLNIKKLKTLKNLESFSINHVFQCTSYKTFLPVLDYCIEQNLHLVLIRLTHPTHLTINSLPPKLHQKFLTEVQAYQKIYKNNVTVREWINYATGILENYNYNLEEHTKFKNHINLMDEIRQTSFIDVFGEI
jgi:MoaA/NifB/PqqE/SkfB family radical SAM enzyme